MNARALLQRLLEDAGAPDPGTFVLVLDADGLGPLPESIDVRGIRYLAYRLGTELELRRVLMLANGAPLVAVIPAELARRLPPDLLRRSWMARVMLLREIDVLSAAIDVQVTHVDDAGALSLALERADAIKAHLAGRGDTLPTVIDGRLLDELLVEASLELRLRSASAGAALAALVQRWPQEDARLSSVLRRHLPVRYGATGRLLAWCLGGEGRPAALVVHGVLLDCDAASPVPAVWGPLADAEHDPAVGLTGPAMRRTAAAVAVEALPHLPDHGAAYIERAESLGRTLLKAEVIGTSRVMPLGLENRCEALARRASGGEVVEAEELAWLRAHAAAPRFRRDIDAVEEMARLSRYLATATRMTASDLTPTLGDLVRDYQSSGAFADLAALRLKRALGATDRFHVEAAAILHRWLQARDAANLAFASQLAAGYAAAIHGGAVTPVHRVWSRHVLGRLRDTGSGLFMVVLDGCSYPLFIELVADLATDSAFPVGLEAADETGGACGLPGLALLPSITSHSRGALMLGAIPDDPLATELVWRGEKETVTDRARLGRNRDLADRSRKLFLKGDLTPDGGAALKNALQDGTVSVVVAVFNAIDDLIGSAAVGAPLAITGQAVAGLLPALRAAIDAGREILLVADHGHTPFLGIPGLRVGDGPTPRYCELAPSAPPPEGFIPIDLGGLGGTPARLGFAWRVGVYLGKQQVGFHGGASLEEMVVPMAWLVKRGVPADEPEWWFAGAVARPAGDGASWDAPAALEPAGRARAGGAAPPIGASSSAGAAGAAAKAMPSLATVDLGIPAEIAETLDAQERAALALLVVNHSATTAELAAALSVRTARVNGLMARLNRRLSEAGCERFISAELPSGQMQYERTEG